MGSVFRHITLRLWITALGGALTCTVLLPFWHHVMGLDGLWAPVLGTMALVFLFSGFVMNRFGAYAIHRQIAEAAVWERAGMARDAEAAFERAKALYDGFWLSPRQRRRSAERIMLRLARFYLVRPASGTTGRTILLAYVTQYPHNEEVALGWLERMLHQDTYTPDEHEAAARINDALPDNERVQRLLLQFYLKDMRSDFEAVQTYRRVWRRGGRLPEDLVRKMARVLLEEACLGDWALDVYLKGYALGDVYCLEGLAACVHALRPNADNRDALAEAEGIIAGLDDARRRKLTRRFEHLEPVRENRPTPSKPAESVETPFFRFEPAAAEEDEEERSRPPRRAARTAAVLIGRLTAPYRRAPRLLKQMQWPPGLRRRWTSGGLRRTAAYALTAGAVMIVLVIGWQTIGRRPEPAHAPEPAAQAPAPRITDPFTIQVAAYLKSRDAQIYVDRLKKQNIDAYWTKATSAQRTWYQVKVSHFATKDDARRYGESLKTRGLIDDFYVANYTRRSMD